MGKVRVATKIHVPAPGTDRPKLLRVGLIALGCFVVGVAWPRIAGWQLAPRAPVEEPETAAPPASDTIPAKKAPKPKPLGTGKKPEKKLEPADRVRIKEVRITSCRNASGVAQRECDDLDLDSVVRSRILALGSCSNAEKATGMLSLGLEVDFDRDKVVDLLRGKSTTLSSQAANSLMECAKKELESASFKAVEHQYPRYTVFFLVDFLTPRQVKEEVAEKEEEAKEDTSASGMATVGWEVALVRGSPKDGAVVARLLTGTRVVVTGRQGDWYKIRYDAKGREGWVFKAAIGL